VQPFVGFLGRAHSLCAFVSPLGVLVKELVLAGRLLEKDLAVSVDARNPATATFFSLRFF